MGAQGVYEKFRGVSRRIFTRYGSRVTTMPNRTLSFQVIFTGCESDDTTMKMFMAELCGLATPYSACS